MKSQPTPDKRAVLISLKKARTLMDKIITMLEEDKYCIDIMQQNLAAIGLLKSAHQNLLDNHLHSCFYNAMESKQEQRKQEMIEEILKVSKIANK